MHPFLRLQREVQRLQVRPGLQVRHGLRLQRTIRLLRPLQLRPIAWRRQGRDKSGPGAIRKFQTMAARTTFVDVQLAAAATAARQDDWDTEFRFLERAHILAQASTGQHVRVHWLMLRWAMRQRNCRELAGQIPRIFGAAVLTAAGMVPKGNTGGTNVSMFRPLPVPADLTALMSPAPPDNDRDRERH